MATPPTQLTLGVLLNDDATFDNFLISDVNLQIVQSLRDPRPDSRSFISGGPVLQGSPIYCKQCVTTTKAQIVVLSICR